MKSADFSRYDKQIGMPLNGSLADSRSANSIFPDINYRTALGGVLSYIVKGAEPKAVTALGLNLKQPGGELWGKRSGTSENIGRTARSRA